MPALLGTGQATLKAIRACVLFVFACSSARALEIEIKDLTPCRLDLSKPPSSWREVAPTGTVVTLRVPSDAVQSTDEKSIHGAELWKSPALTIRVALGHWSLASFLESETLLRCRLPLEGGDVAVIERRAEDGVEFAVFIPQPDQVFDAVVGVSAAGEAAESAALGALSGIQRISVKN